MPSKQLVRVIKFKSGAHLTALCKSYYRMSKKILSSSLTVIHQFAAAGSVTPRVQTLPISLVILMLPFRILATLLSTFPGTNFRSALKRQIFLVATAPHTPYITQNGVITNHSLRRQGQDMCNYKLDQFPAKAGWQGVRLTLGNLAKAFKQNILISIKICQRA